jgi:hypothetical protein
MALLLFLAPAPVRAGTPDLPDPLLAKARATVEQFSQQFNSLRYDEDLEQQKLKSNEKVDYQRKTLFDSITIIRWEEGEVRITEQRLTEKRPAHVDARPLLATYGFSALAMVFHPSYESSFRFTRLGDDALQGASLTRIRFEHLPGTPSPILYQMIAEDRPLDLSGTAWLDPATGEIHRVEVEIGSTMSDTGVKSIRAVLQYAPVVLQGEMQPQWLPASATIDLETPRQHWRNIHRFTDYRKFRVDVKMNGGSQP